MSGRCIILLGHFLNTFNQVMKTSFGINPLLKCHCDYNVILFIFVLNLCAGQTGKNFIFLPQKVPARKCEHYIFVPLYRSINIFFSEYGEWEYCARVICKFFFLSKQFLVRTVGREK